MAGLYPDEHTLNIFGTEVLFPGLDPVTGKFTDGDFSDPMVKPSRIPAGTFNLIIDILGDVIESCGKTPNNVSSQQLSEALRSFFAPLESPALTGTPTAPTAEAGTNTAQIATMAALLNNVSNSLSDASATKALSAAQGKALNDAKAPLASPALTGTPTAPTAEVSVSDTQIATMAAAHAAAKLDSHPVGGYYTQYPVAGMSDPAAMFPAEEAPATLFGGTWTQPFAGEGVFFRSEGGQSMDNRADGIQEDRIRNITGTVITQVDGVFSGYVSGAFYQTGRYYAWNPTGGTDNDAANICMDASRTVPTGSDNAPRNRLLRVWKRTA